MKHVCACVYAVCGMCEEKGVCIGAPNEPNEPTKPRMRMSERER